MLPMLGILYIGGALRQIGVEPLLWDGNYSPEPPVDEVDILMVTANSGTYSEACRMAQRVKAEVKVIGGPHVTAVGLPDGPFDVACRGEGEAVAQGIIDHQIDRGVIRATKPLPIDNIPWPAYDLWPELGQESAVAVEGNEPGLGAAIITSRGCPYACNFCSSELMWGRRVRFRKVSDVLAEAQHLRDDFGITQLRIQDDTANVQKQRFAELCIGLDSLGIKWRMNTRTDNVTLDELRFMKAHGCVEIGFGVESGSRRMLDLMGKANTVRNSEDAIRWAHEAGLPPRIYLIVGFPGETRESIEETLAFLRRVPAHRAAVNAFIPYPGCAVWKDPAAFNCTIEHQDWDAYWQQNREDDEAFPCTFPSMSQAELREAVKVVQAECERLFGSADRRQEIRGQRTAGAAVRR